MYCTVASCEKQEKKCTLAAVANQEVVIVSDVDNPINVVMEAESGSSGIPE